MNYRSCLPVIVLACVATFTLPLPAQTFYGSIVGAVTDSSGAAIPGASITLTNSGTAERRPVVADATGIYRFLNLIPGSYRIDVEHAGFKHLTRDSITVEVGGAVRIDASLQIGEVSQTLEVTGQTPLLQTESTTLGQVVEAQKVREMPLNGRDVYNLVALVPGVVQQGGGGSNVQIGGGMSNQNASFLDGVPQNNGYANQTVKPLPQDAVQEFRVQTNAASAEYGRFSGGVINLTSKTGTNQFHGSAYEFLRNRVLNGNTFFSNSSGLARPPFTQNQYGATLGGPVKKDRLFFFYSWENFSQRQGSTMVLNVPTAAFRAGDFSNLRDASGKVTPIHDPLTVCGQYGNAACAKDPAGNPVYTRQPFPGNSIPVNRQDPTSKIMTAKLWALPNTAGSQYTNVGNFVTNASSGSTSTQHNVRGDYNLSDKQRLFARYSRYWTTPVWLDPYGTGLPNGGGTRTNPTTQAVVGDTYTLTPTTILDLRLAFVRNENNRYPPQLGLDLTTIGWPAFMNSQVQYQVLPMVCLANYDGVHLCNGDPSTVIILRNNVYTVAPSLSKMAGKHTLKFGGEIRKIQYNFSQSQNPSGNFTFTNLFTSVNPLAQFLLGDGTSGSATMARQAANQEVYEAYYVNDTWAVNKKLTVNYGVRWELPISWTERFDRATVLLPYADNPLAKTLGLPLKGSVGLVNSPDRADRHVLDFPWKLFSPRFGIAYRVTNQWVIRTGFGITYLPNDVVFNASPANSPVNAINTTWVPTADGGVTAATTMSNPFPTGLNQALGHNPSFLSQLIGQNVNSPLASNPYAYNEQWNFNVQRELKDGLLIEVAYAGAHGVHLPTGNQQLNQLPDQYLSLGSKLQQQVPNPFYGLTTIGTLATPTVAYGQLLRPYPQYTGYSMQMPTNRNSSYQSLQAKLEKRFRSAGSILAAYTWAKVIADTETTTNYMESNTGGGSYTVQNYNNLRLERSLGAFDVPQRLVVSYVLDLPLGKGKKFLGGATGVADKLVSGWGFNGISTFQSGFPLSFKTTNNLTNSFGGGSRPNVVAGCNPALSTPAQSSLTKWFDTGCFSQPASFTFGTAARVDPKVRGAGINNFD
ncbi:MAG: TonB-dependent receptor, partial [Candidatus Solibacter sp.]|nr:TonB-dependent receptor [Candidatus Solibacter sp.]